MPTRRASHPPPGRIPKRAKRSSSDILLFTPTFASDDPLDCEEDPFDDEEDLFVSQNNPTYGPPDMSHMYTPKQASTSTGTTNLALAKTKHQSRKGSNVPCFDPTNNVLNSSPMMTVLVGSARVRFLVHRDILEQPYAGNFLNAALPLSGFKKSSVDVLGLPEDSPKVFGTFVRWLYGITLGLGPAQESISTILPNAESRINTYEFAREYLCYDLQDIIMSDMYDRVSQGRKFVTDLSQDLLQQFVTNVPRSHMHTLLAKWIAKDTLLGDINKQDKTFDMVPNDLLRMVLGEMHGGASAGQAQQLLGLPCDYHLHKGSGVCSFR